MPDDALTVLASADPLAALNGLGLETFLTMVGTLISIVSVVTGNPKERFRPDGPFALAYISFTCGALQYYLFLTLSGMDFGGWVQSFTHPVTLTSYVLFLFLLTLIVKVILASIGYRSRLIVCVFGSAAGAVFAMYLWCVFTAVAINGDSTDSAKWTSLVILMAIVLGVPALVGLVFKRFGISDGQSLVDASRNMNYARAKQADKRALVQQLSNYDSLSNTAVSIGGVLLVCALLLAGLDVFRSELINAPGWACPVVSGLGEEMTRTRSYNVALLTTEAAWYRDGNKYYYFTFHYDEKRTKVAYKGYDNGRLDIDASASYKKAAVRRAMTQRKGYKNVSVCRLESGERLFSTLLRTNDGIDEWVESKYKKTKDGCSYCSEDSITRAEDGTLIRRYLYDTLDGAQGHVLVGKYYDGNGNFQYNFVRSYDDSWREAETAWFDESGVIEYISYWDNGSWQLKQSTNWKDYYYNLPGSVDRAELHDLFDYYFSNASLYEKLFPTRK